MLRFVRVTENSIRAFAFQREAKEVTVRKVSRQRN